jgi:hypothetical protein
MSYWPTLTRMQATRRPVLYLSRFFGDPLSPLGFVVQHYYRLESICYVATDLCVHQFRCHPFLSSARVTLAVVVRRAVHTPPGGHRPVSAIPNHFVLTRVHLSSWFLTSCPSTVLPVFWRRRC